METRIENLGTLISVWQLQRKFVKFFNPDRIKRLTQRVSFFMIENLWFSTDRGRSNNRSILGYNTLTIWKRRAIDRASPATLNLLHP